MWDACKLLWSLLVGLFRSRASLEAENLVLRQQTTALERWAAHVEGIVTGKLSNVLRSLSSFIAATRQVQGKSIVCVPKARKRNLVGVAHRAPSPRSQSLSITSGAAGTQCRFHLA